MTIINKKEDTECPVENISFKNSYEATIVASFCIYTFVF